MTPRRELVVAVGTVLLGAGAALLASTQGWLAASAGTGRTTSPGAFALALVGLAGLVAVLATRGIGRRVVGLLVVIAGLLLAWSSVRGWGWEAPHNIDPGFMPVPESRPTFWPWVSVAGGLVVAVGGLLTVLRGGRWPGMSSRYERPSGAARTGEDDTWRALDRGEDPTA